MTRAGAGGHAAPVTTLALMTPDAGYDEFDAVWRARVEAYARMFAARGVALAPAPWTGPPPSGVAGALACLAWGYHLRPDDWTAALGRWSAVPLVNPAPLLGWNTRKTYLAELGRAGVPVVPTAFVAVADAAALAAAHARFGDALVVKPQVSGAAHNTRVVRRGEDAGPPLADAMIQPMLPAVAAEGELSLIHFGGALSHALRKVAAPGDFRVQREHGGVFTRLAPDAEARRVALAALAACPVAPAYARVDLIRLPGGGLGVMELEAIEPDLYLDLAPDREEAFVEAVLVQLTR